MPLASPISQNAHRPRTPTTRTDRSFACDGAQLQWACYFHALAVAPRYPQHLAGRVLGYNNVAIALTSDVLPYFLTRFVAGGDHVTSGEKEWGYAWVRTLLVLPVAASSAFLAHELRSA